MKAIPLAVLVPLATLCAQRPEPTFEWQKRATTITYGAVPVGQHGLEELTVGASWRLGMGEASTWLATMPILAGETWIAPGHYRITLWRTDETHCEIAVDGSQQALGGGQGVRVHGEVKKAGKPSKKLAIEWAKNGAAAAGNQPAKLSVTFGPSEWQGEVLVLGNKTVNVPGGKLAVFSVPAKHLESRDTAVPIAVLSKGKDGDSWNLLLGKTEARLVPWMAAPKEQYGFGDIAPPDEKLETKGTANAVEGNADKEVEVMELRESSLTKGELRLVVAFGKEVLEVRVPEPKVRGGK